MNKTKLIAKIYKKLTSSSASDIEVVLSKLDEDDLYLTYEFIQAHKLKSSNANYMQDEFLSILVKKAINGINNNKKR